MSSQILVTSRRVICGGIGKLVARGGNPALLFELRPEFCLSGQKII